MLRKSLFGLALVSATAAGQTRDVTPLAIALDSISRQAVLPGRLAGMTARSRAACVIAAA